MSKDLIRIKMFHIDIMQEYDIRMEDLPKSIQKRIEDFNRLKEKLNSDSNNKKLIDEIQKESVKIADKIMYFIDEVEQDNVYPKNVDDILIVKSAEIKIPNSMPIHILDVDNTKVHIKDGVVIVEKNDKSIVNYTEQEMLDFAWFVVENVGKIFSCDRTAHFEGAFLRMFKKLKNGNNNISN